MSRSKFITPDERRRMIEVFLRESGWTWYRLAQEMGLSQSTLNKIFKHPESAGYGDPRASVLMRLARATGTSVGFWVDRDGE